ncbi:LacI family DNA-binding transcriptional regulator [Flagellimonas flava]|uniref:LacI family DNA-binding transcriptional regulator n=1 Tax=Flagellimonas flava TaxID=570519 RepID=UPI003D645F2E
MANNRTTLRELSQLLDLSISTVSKALSDSKEISEKTKERVKETAVIYNYRQNKLASCFRTGSTKVIGVVVPTLTDIFFSEVLSGIERYLSANGYAMMVAVSDDSISKEAKVLKSLSNGFVDGLIISNAQETLVKASNKSMSVPINDGIPMVLFGRKNPMVKCDQILNDFSTVSFQLVEYLHRSQKCNNIVAISTEDDIINTRAKIDGFKQALNFFGLSHTLNSVLIYQKADLINKISEVIEEGKFDGILCLDYASYNLLSGILTGLSAEVFDNIQVATFGNINLLKRLPCASIDLQAKKIGRITARTLLDRIKDRKINYNGTRLIKGNLLNHKLTMDNELRLY